MPPTSIEEFVKNSMAAGSTAALVAQFKTVMETFGFEVLSYYILQRGFREISARSGQRVHRDKSVVEDFFPGDMPVAFDPRLAAVINKLEPYHWFEVEQHPDLSERLRYIYRRLREDGFEDGIGVPVVTRPGDLSLFALSTRNRKFDLSKSEMRVLQFACQAMHARYDELSRTEPEPNLSDREREVMGLVARGASNSEIAKRLQVSSHTVDTHIRRSFLKLGVNSRIEAAIKLACSGILAGAA
ncbi:MAG: LuxR C-terminal-related transcriptional regulator [Parvularculaceae bacterium]